MISALKRLVAPSAENAAANNNGSVVEASAGGHTENPAPGSNGSKAGSSQAKALVNNGMAMISQSLQKKFSKGVNYNMKIVIKGDYNTGKSTLWHRLQGHAFKEQYEPSDEIRVANINWNSKSNDHIVKVEVWDVVDRSKKKRYLLEQQNKNSNSLKLDNTTVNKSAGNSNGFEASLDAEFIDVYKNANGCILVYDITKQWTWDYVERELPKIPSHIPVLVVGNHRDMHHHRTVDQLGHCRYFIENLSRGSLGTAVRYTETSMRSGFGLKYLYQFFNIPFLQLQREHLMQQLEINAREMDNICEELQQLEENIEIDYEEFAQNLNSLRRKEQEAQAPQDALKNAKSVEEAKRLAQEREERERAAQAQLAQSALDLNQEPKQIVNQIISKINTKLPIGQTSEATSGGAASVKLDPNMASNLTSREIQNAILRQQQQQQQNQKLQPSKSPSNSQISPAKSNVGNAALSSIDGFSLNHDDELNRFLDDPFKAAAATFGTKSPSRDKISQPEQTQHNQGALNNVHESDDDEDDDDTTGNPIVAAYKETIDSSDEEKTKPQNKNNKQPVAVVKPIGMSKNSSANSSSSKVIKPIKSIEISDDEEEVKQVEPEEEEQNKIEINSFEEVESKASQPPQPPQFQLSIDDFDFLEKMTSKPPTAPSVAETGTKKKVKKSATSKSSNKLLVDVTASDNDDSSSMVSSDSKKTKTKKSVKSSASKNNLISVDQEDTAVSSKKKSTTKKSTTTKKKSTKRETENDDDDGDGGGGVVVKQDLDYEDI